VFRKSQDPAVARRSRITGLVFFIALVAAVQVLEYTYRWYVHREDRAHLAVLREELVDAGAEMIRSQLEMEKLRAELRTADPPTSGVRAVGVPPRIGAGERSLHPHLHAAGLTDWRATPVAIAERNRRLNELNEVVMRRNSAAIRYHTLADSIRTLAVRARDPYFAIPLPAEAATARGVEPPERPGGVARFGSGGPRGEAYGGALWRAGE
jgi:hypothetical protein